VIGAWLLFPILLIALALGCGLSVERVARVRVPGALLVPVGLATLIALGHLTTATDATAELTVPAVVVLAVVGFAQAARRGGLRPDPWAALATAAVFAVYAAPVLLSGEATFAGYIRLDDTATWLALTDRMMEHGHNLSNLAPSTYEATLALNLGAGYPIGAFVPLGIGHSLTSIDPAWIIQPYISVLAASIALSAWHLTERVVPSRPLRAVVVAVGAQPALLVGYAQWGGVKEVAAAALVVLSVALIPPVIRASVPPGRVALLAIAIAALAAVLSLGGLIWVLPALAIAAWLVAREHGRRAMLGRAGWLTAGVTILSLPLVVPAILDGRLLPPTSSSLASETARGNLASPLGLDRLFGIWPAGDFRFPAEVPVITAALMAVVALFALIGIWRALADRRGALGLLTPGVGGACLLLVLVGSPWVDGKAMATASPAILITACAGAGALIVRRNRVVGAVALVLIGGGVLWSNALAYRDASLAPRDQLAELEQVGDAIEGEGPTLMTEYQPYGSRHFLRAGEPEGVSELRRRLIPLRGGELAEKGTWADTDDLALDGLVTYRTLVLRHSPEQSRPPSIYELEWSGDYYEVWQRPPGPPGLKDRHLPLGGAIDPGGVAACEEVRRLARGASGLAYVPASPVVVMPSGGKTVDLPRAGTWHVWIRGSVAGELRIRVDGEPAGSLRNLANNEGLWANLGAVDLGAGGHRIELSYEGASLLHPGSGAFDEPAGPLALTLDGPRAVRTISPARAKSLCGERLDWIESLPYARFDLRG
jgi:hypothetical protein